MCSLEGVLCFSVKSLSLLINHMGIIKEAKVDDTCSRHKRMTFLFGKPEGNRPLETSRDI
jgi:hypothetical protein